MSLFLILFGMVYEHFSYSVYSAFMAYAFLFPFVGGYLYLKVRHSLRLSGKFPRFFSPYADYMHLAGICFLTVGSIFKGILDIYGTTNKLGIFYWIIGVGFIAFSIFCSFRPKQFS